MRIERPRYINQLIKKRENGLIKVITGIRRCGKSYLLNVLFRDYLLSTNVNEKQIISLSLDDLHSIKYRNPLELDAYIRSKIVDKKRMHYAFLDEIQMVSELPNPYTKDSVDKITFVDVLLGLMKIENLDIYVTGSNSRMLSSDILTTFRDRGDEVKVYPLSFSEYVENYPTFEKHKAWNDYWTYGGMPYLSRLDKHEEKTRYLENLIERTYIADILDRNRVHNESEVLEDLLNFLASSTGSLSNPTRLANTFRSKKGIDISHTTIARYLFFFEDAFLIEKALRYDVKGRKYINTPVKYYFTDIGLRNAKLNFRQQEETHIMENIIYNELVMRGYNVDVGSVEAFEKHGLDKTQRKQLEIDFVVNRASQRYYIQSVLHIDTEEKRKQEKASLLKIEDSFKKIILQKGTEIPWHDEDGILHMGVELFLLDENALNL